MSEIMTSTLFSDEEADHPKDKDDTPWNVLIVDDDEEIHSVTKLVLQGFKFKKRPLRLLSAYSGAEAVKVMQSESNIAVMLLDVVMENDLAGLEVIRQVRDELQEHLVRIVLRTGQPGQAPEKEIIENYDINDYKDKTELTSQKLITLLYSTLRAYDDIHEIQRKKQALTKYYEKTVSELHESKRHIFNVIDSMPSILIGINSETKITDWNSTAVERTGIPYQQALGQDLYQVIPYARRFKTTIDATLTEQSSQQLHRIGISLEKQQHFFDVDIYPITIGKSSGAVIRLDDITEYMAHENVLIESEKMATIGGMAAGIAHEIQNPLSIIIQNSQNISNRIDPQAKKNQEVAQQLDVDLNKVNEYLEARNIVKFVANMRDAADKSLNLISNLIGFGNPNDADMNYMNLSELVEEALALLAKDINIKQSAIAIDKVDFQKEVSDNIPDIPCIHSQLVQVFLSIFRFCVTLHDKDSENALIKYKIKDDNNHVLLNISSNGHVLDEQTQQNIFKAFFTDNKHNTSDTGLGLSVTHYIVTEQHNGSISISSDEELGTSFTIGLPKQPRSSGITQ